MTRLQDGQDETKEKKFKPNGQTIKSPYFSGTLSAAILKTPSREIRVLFTSSRKLSWFFSAFASYYCKIVLVKRR